MTTESLSVTIEGELLTVEIGIVAAPTSDGGASAWGDITGTLSDQTDLTSALALKAPIASPTLTGTPAAPTAAGATSTTQIATTAFVGGEITTHAGATDPHGDRSFSTSAVSTHSALTTGAHGITAAGAALLDDADAAAQRTTLGLGTAATTAATAYEASGAIATHNAVTTAHGISAFGATLVDDADAGTARTTLGLGTAATSASGDFATAGHNHSGVYQPSDAELTAIAGLTSAADSAPYFTGSGTAALMTVTAAGRALIDDADATAQRTTLGLAIGTNVQAYDADLTTWAGITPGTGVATALGTNIGTAGAFVTNGGALGTPSSGTLTNATGLPPAGITQSGATSNQVLAWNGSAWAPATPSAGSGDVVGPASATDNAIARYDTTTGKLVQDSGVTVSDVSGSSVTLASTAGNALAIAATAPAATTGASQAGKAASLTATAAVASTDTAGAAAGGSVTITAGAAARLTSGNANGGDITLTPGAGIGTGVQGRVVMPTGGSAAAPSITFSGDTDTGIFRIAANEIGIACAGATVMDIASGLVVITGALSGHTRQVANRIADATETFSSLVTTNTGAGVGITRTMQSLTAGVTHTFIDNNATYRLTIKPNTADQIIWTDGTVVSAATGSIVSTARYNSFTGVSVDVTTFVVLSATGTWTVTP